MSPRVPRDTTAFELRDALAQPGCAVCSLTLRSVGRFLVSVAYERVNDLQTRAELRARGGFCNVHAYRWLREAHNVLGTALIYKDVLHAALADEAWPAERRRVRLLDALIGRKGGNRPMVACPACSAQHEAEDRYLSGLLAIVVERAGAEAFAASDGLCLVHAMAAQRRGGRGTETLIARTRQSIEQLIGTLDEVIRKEDYRFRTEPRTEPERTAPAGAIAAACGAEGLVVERAW